MGKPPCPPNTACWCATKPPNHPCHNPAGVPINNGLIFLALAGMLLIVFRNRIKPINKE